MAGMCERCEAIGLEVKASGEETVCFYHLSLARGFTPRSARSYCRFLSSGAEAKAMNLPSLEQMRLIALLEGE